jgi:hypothetical protein
MNTLKVGDVVYGTSYNDIWKYVIERVTKTQAISGNIKFKIGYGDNWVSVIGERGYSRTSYYISTPELEEKYVRYKIINKISHFDFGLPTTNELITIIKIIKPYTNLMNSKT